jgi:organic hydroperoxide reductase OsmC/OhrA
VTGHGIVDEATDPVRRKQRRPYNTKGFRIARSQNGLAERDVPAAGKPAFRVASPPEFRGEKNVWTPEDLLVGAVETCLLMTFASIAQKRDLPIDAYYSESTGQLDFVGGGYRFTRIIVKPTIIVASEEAIEPTMEAIRRAHRECLVANSLVADVIVEPEICMRHAA